MINLFYYFLFSFGLNLIDLPILFIHKNEIKEYVNGAISQKTFTEKVEKLIQ